MVFLPVVLPKDVEPARVRPGEAGTPNEFDDDQDEERGRDPRGGACEGVGTTGNITPPISVVVPASHFSNPSVIFLSAADRAASSSGPAPRTDITEPNLASRYI